MRREEWIDSLRGGAILLVVIGHSGCPEYIYNFIYSFHMPLFFIISGYLFNAEKWKDKGIWIFLKSRITSYVKPYFILCGVNYFLCFIEEIVKNGISIDTVNLMKTWALGILYVYPDVEHMPDCTPLWFLVALTLASIFLFFILRLRSIRLQIIMVGFIAMVDAILAETCSIQLPWCFGAVLIGCCCMYIGQAIRKYSLLVDRKLVLIALFIIGTISSCANGRVGIGANIIGRNPILFWISALSLSFVTMCLMRKTDDRFWLLSYYGKNTILFMGFNYFFNSITGAVWYSMPIINQYNYNWIVKSIVCVVCISVLILLWNKIKNKIPDLAILGF